MVKDLDRAIDALYRLPLAAFTAARNALAKEEAGEARARVRALQKPGVVPAVVNYLYWDARPDFDRLMRAGAALRTAQIDALEGRANRVAAASVAHREAVAAAVARATELGGAAGVRPAAEPLSRKLEALSMAPAAPAQPGRLVESVLPSGFEAMAGVVPVGRNLSLAGSGSPSAGAGKRDRESAADVRRRTRDADIHRTRAELEAARALEARAQMRLHAAREQVAEREREAREALADVRRAEAAVRRAEKPLA